MKRILVYGSLNIDLVFPVDHIAAPGETVAGTALFKNAGGKGANQAAALARAGAAVSLAGKIGADGRFIVRLLESFGVNTERVAEWEGATGQALIQVDRRGENAIVLYPGGNGAVTVNEIYRVIADFGAGDTVLLQNEIAGAGEIMRAAGERGMRVCFNPSPCDETIRNLPLDLVDMFFVNEIEGASLASSPLPSSPLPSSPERLLEALVRRFPRAEIVLTAGKAGAWYGYRENRARGEIVALPVVDTTGAGDTFTGYFLAARERNFPVERSLALACKAASIAVSRQGAMEAMPSAGEVFD